MILKSIAMQDRKIPSVIVVLLLIQISQLRAKVVYENVTSLSGLDDVLPVHNLRSGYEILYLNNWYQIGTNMHISDETTRFIVLNSIIATHHEFAERLLKFERDNKDQVRMAYPEFENISSWESVQNHIIAINSRFEIVRNHLAKKDYSALEVFTKTQSSSPPGESIYSSDDNYYCLIAQQINDKDVCKVQKSPQQFLLDIYTSLSLTDLKGQFVLQVSFMFQQVHGMVNYARRAEGERNKYEEHLRRILLWLHGGIQSVENSFFRCDPAEHEEGRTFEQLTNLLQGYIDPRHLSCQNDCSYDHKTKSTSCKYSEIYLSISNCTGRVINCLPDFQTSYICPAMHSLNRRRIEFISFENGQVFGKRKSCSMGTFFKCDNCFCICEGDKAADRFFSLKEVTTNVSENRIITGVRFRKVNRVVHLQIQEGNLGRRGTVEASSAQWKKVPDVKVDDDNFKDGVDYFTINWTQRAIDLTDVQGRPGFVVTGVRFRITYSHLNLEVRFTKFDFVPGRLVDLENASYWRSQYSNRNFAHQQSIDLKQQDVPIKRKNEQWIVNRQLNRFVEFTHSDVHMDAAQTTVPYLDAQDVVPIPPMPLNGIGLYYKSSEGGSGSFVGPRVYTYNPVAHVQLPISKRNSSYGIFWDRMKVNSSGPIIPNEN